MQIDGLNIQVLTDKGFRKIMGYTDLWMLKVQQRPEASVDAKEKVVWLCAQQPPSLLFTAFGTGSDVIGRP